MRVRYAGWKETIAESHFEDNRSANNIDLFNSLSDMENGIYGASKIARKQNMLTYTLAYARLNS